MAPIWTNKTSVPSAPIILFSNSTKLRNEKMYVYVSTIAMHEMLKYGFKFSVGTQLLYLENWIA